MFLFFLIPIPSHSCAVNFHSFPFSFPSLSVIPIPVVFSLGYSHSHLIPNNTFVAVQSKQKFQNITVSECCLKKSVKVFWKSVNVGGSYGQQFSVVFFDSRCSVLAAERKLFVGRLAPSLTEADLISVFATFGDIEDCTVIRRPDSRLSAGCSAQRGDWKCETWICGTSLHGWKLRDMKMRDQFAGVEMREKLVWKAKVRKSGSK